MACYMTLMVPRQSLAMTLEETLALGLVESWTTMELQTNGHLAVKKIS